MRHQLLASWNKPRMAYGEQSGKLLPTKKIQRETFLSKSPISIEKILHTNLERLFLFFFFFLKPFKQLGEGQNYFYK